jgi:hypothetical protein
MNAPFCPMRSSIESEQPPAGQHTEIRHPKCLDHANVIGEESMDMVKRSFSINGIGWLTDRYRVESYRHHLAWVLDPRDNAVWGD